MQTQQLFPSIVELIHQKLVYGALKNGGSWGGPECKAAISFSTHLIESAAWLFIWTSPFLFTTAITSVSKLSTEITEAATHNKPTRSTLDITLSLLHFSIYGAVIYYKWQISSLINLIQPCHVILLLEGISLCSTNTTGSVLLPLFLLPALSGTLLAILFPDMAGLDQFLEPELYWVQHYLIIVVPVYLLSRRKFFALQYASVFTTFMGLSILGVLHFFFYEAIDLLLGVNVEFMLCPTGAMVSIFSTLPEWVTYPTYRTVLTFVVILVGYLLSFLYTGIAKLLGTILSS
eukprot:gene32006-42706_t